MHTTVNVYKQMHMCFSFHHKSGSTSNHQAVYIRSYNTLHRVMAPHCVDVWDCRLFCSEVKLIYFNEPDCQCNAIIYPWERG